MTTRWRLKPHDPARIAALSREAGVSPLVAQLLLNRGIDDPAQARDVPPGEARRPARPRMPCRAPSRRPTGSSGAVRDRRKIVIYGDYDVDGVCGTSILWACLRLAGAERRRLLHPAPGRGGVRRQRRGAPAARGRGTAPSWSSPSIAGSRPSTRRRLARELGLELIVTDHHTHRPGLARGRRDRPSAARRGAAIPAPTSAARRWRSSSPGRSARASATARRRRPTSATSWSSRSAWSRWRPWPTSSRSAARTASSSGTAWPGMFDRADGRDAGLDGGLRLPRQEAADGRDRRLRPRSPDQRRGPARTGDEGRRDAHDRRYGRRPRDRRRARPLQHAAARRSSRRSSTEAHEMIRRRGARRPGRDRPRTRGLAPRRHRDRRQPPGRDYHRPAVVVALDDAARPGLGAVDPGLQPLRGDQGVLRGPDRLRRPQRRGRAEAPRRELPGVRRDGSTTIADRP